MPCLLPPCRSPALSSPRAPRPPQSTAQDCGTADLYNCYRSLDARVEAYIAANKARLGAPASVDYQACASPPYQSLLHDMTVSYDDLVGALVDNGEPAGARLAGGRDGEGRGGRTRRAALHCAGVGGGAGGRGVVGQRAARRRAWAVRATVLRSCSTAMPSRSDWPRLR